jgi:hypothetical protein
MAQYLVYSLRKNGGHYADAKVVLTVGEAQIIEGLDQLYPWLKKQNVEVRWMPLELYSELIYFATAQYRLCYEYESDMVLFMDADMLFRHNIDELVWRMHRQQKFTGLIPHICPFESNATWEEYYKFFELGPMRAVHQLTGWPYMQSDLERRFTPAYFNYGFILMPSSYAKQIGEIIFDVMRKSTQVVDSYYKCQTSLAISLVKLGLPYECLQMRYNFANNLNIEALHGAEMPHAVILHLLADHQGVFKTFYDSDEGLEAFLAREDLAGVNLMAQDVIRSVHAEALADWHEEPKREGAFAKLLKGRK